MRGIVKSFMTVLFVQASLLGSAAGQTPANLSGATRSVIANVIDSHGNPVRDLTKESFALFLNGKPAVVTNARYSSAAHRIVVLLDLSGSMAGTTTSGKWRIAVEAVRDLLTQTDSGLPIAMVTFASGIQETFDFHQGKTAILNWLLQNADRPPKLKKKKTALFDAIGAALKLLGDPQFGDAIYAITDGGENASSFSAHKIEEDLLHSGVRLFSLLFGGPISPHEAEAEGSFAGMIENSGGQAFVLPGLPIRGVWDAQYSYDSVNRGYVETYTADLNTEINGFWILELAQPSSG